MLAEAGKPANAVPAPGAGAATLNVCRRLGRYDVRHLVASGGMASVSLARLSTAEGFSKWVAIKTIHPHIAIDPRFIRMFLNEATLAARIDHPNVCSVFDFGEAEGEYFLAMEYLHGEALGRVLRRTESCHRPGLPVALAVRIIADAARGLHAAHELVLDDGRPAGVVHRDISPQNLFVLYGGMTKVVDFGIARSVEHAGENTTTGEIKGKLSYMAPEQIHALSLDRRTDVWALGVVLWECVAGARLFRRANDPATMRAVLSDPIPPASIHGREVPPEIDAIIARALARNAEDRYPTALALARDLEAWLVQSGSPIGPDDVAAEMRELFHDDIVARDELLHRVAAAPAVEPGGVPASREESGIRDSMPIPLMSAHVPPHRPDWMKLFLGVSLVTVLGVGGGLFAVSRVGDRSPLRSPPLSIGGVSRPESAPESPPVARTASIPLTAALPSIAPSDAGVATSQSAPVVAVPIATVSAPPSPSANGPSSAGGTSAPPATRVAVRPARRGVSVAAAESELVDPTAAIATQRGSLTLFSALPCEVFEGTRSLGHTPVVEARMAPGPHSLRVVPSSGDRAQVVDVSISPGQGSVVSIAWE